MMHETQLFSRMTISSISLRRRRGSLAWLRICCLILIGLAVVVAPDAAHAQDAAPASETSTAADPNFSTIDDPLNGEYELFTVDDLLISRTKPLDGGTRSGFTNYLLKTENETITDQSVIYFESADCYLMAGRQPQQTRIGRFFDLSYDVIVTLHPMGPLATGSECTAPDNEPNMFVSVQDPQSHHLALTSFRMSAANTAVAMADFDLDGFEDLFIINDTEAMVATAHNTQIFTEGMQVGPVTALPSPDYATDHDPTLADFNGDGLMDVAWIGKDEVVHFATICPGPVAGTVCAAQVALAVIMDPNGSKAMNIQVNDEFEDCGGGGEYRTNVALTSGQYTSQTKHDLITVDTYKSGTTTIGNFELPLCGYKLNRYLIDDNFSLISKSMVTLIEDSLSIPGGGYINPSNFYAQSARLSWFNAPEQVIVVIGGVGGNNTTGTNIISVVSFAGAAPQVATTVTESSVGLPISTDGPTSWANGMAIGRFASISDNPDLEAGFNQQIAVLTNDGTLYIYGVPNPPADNKPELLTTSPIDASLGLNERAVVEGTFTSWLVSGDLQGRSARLGAPSVLRVASHSQPSIILGAPPMHVDYILPDASTNADWTVVNFSAVPDAFKSNYTMSQTGGNQSADTNRTSYTYATTEESGGDFSLKPPYLPSISGSIKKTSEDKHEDISETYAFTQNEFQYDTSTSTGFGDEIWFDVSSFNVYYYPVLGETVCPADNASCTPAEEQPLYVVFSGPNSSGTGPAPGYNTEWYQPVHQPGNIFSYPWNESQLKLQMEASIELLTGPQSFYTDGSSQTQRLQWSSGAGQAQTTGSTNTHSYEKAYSLTGGKQIGKIFNVNLKGNLDYNDSTSLSTLNKSSSSVGASQGVAIIKPGTFLNSNLYQYRVEPFIFGRTPPAGTVDNVTLPQNIQTSGPLQAAFAANPLDPNAGSWWGSDVSPYTQQIDVALNHPARWSKSGQAGAPDMLNCLKTSGAGSNCMILSEPNPSNLWNSEFYWMRGLFVTVGGVNGPQRTMANAGDDVVLQARVYNYSFKDMPSGSKIQVRFYRQEIQGTTPVGDSVLIEQVTADPLPGFNSANSPDTPNWTTVTASLATAGLGDTYQIFWVLVWAEDGSGNLIGELSGHGLSTKPGDLTTIGDVPLEEVTFSGEPKTFSNNVGYLHSKFYIAPQGLQAPLPSDGELTIQNAAVTPQSVATGERVIISADFQAVGAPAEATQVRIFPDAQAWQAYQNDPSLPQPRAFDMEMLTYIRADGTDRMEVPYSSASCGTQEILIVAQAAGQAESITASATFDNGACDLFLPVIATGAEK